MSTPPTPDAEEIRHALRQVMDPEVGMNIVDLGLIYRIDCAPGELYIEMTMTTPACPLSDMILDNIDAVLDPLLPPEVNIRVELVWDPPWSPAMMEEGARAHFGWNGCAPCPRSRACPCWCSGCCRCSPACSPASPAWAWRCRRSPPCMQAITRR